MMSILLFRIEFSNKESCYYAGETLTGNVIVHLGSSLELNGVMLRIYGRAKSRVEINNDYYHSSRKAAQNKQSGQRLQLQHWSSIAKEEFVDGAKYIQGNGTPYILDSGRYKFPFHFQLPNEDLPTSYEGDDRCYIRYSVTATLDITNGKDCSIVRMFTLLAPIDVNDSILQKPHPAQESEKDICCCCCQSGPLFLHASADRSGYCPGEEILLQIKIENYTNKAMSGVEVLLIQHLTLKIEGNVSTREQTCSKLFLDTSTGKKESVVWKDKRFRIPVLPPTIQCKIMELNYSLTVTILDRNGLDLSVYIPIIIGTIPLEKLNEKTYSRKGSINSSDVQVHTNQGSKFSDYIAMP
ncbi:uncharacterized protein TRIADDRAFT_59950 [Trichoplax adhaerens]|uniref:Arrestin C-terminal-like domain-containing protein n=1 Tax=Trichoplax adhaerens TaxID=10228 RepID=B3S6W1_TRIAD|nr:hypothetical protein TRIADDRAFT_59950 [Trichoplax adhaerens]EDV21379.1 hypothetical protein TRIADDRAFT_59950 [Trichoplax adhaerens]|eukprot:XP_002115979.1 hypothetical protein TRIADDRAFT_59950 [Trichoplax adhaerens]